MSQKITRLQDDSKPNRFRTYIRTLIILLVLLLQVAIYVLIGLYLREYSVYITAALTILGVVVSLFIFSSRSDAYYKMVWILIILLMPVSGSVIYLFIHNQKGPKRMNKRLKENNAISKKYLSQCEEVIALPDTDPFVGLARYAYNTEGYPAYSNCDFEFFPLGDDFYVGLMREIKKAEKFIFLEFFIIKYGYMWPSILEVLRKKAEEGVEVRLMYDGFNSLSEIPHGYYKLIKSYGIKCRVFAPFSPKPTKIQNNRDHRKILIVDGKVAFTGGNNLADEYMNRTSRFGHWKDTSIMVRGEAVRSFTMMFLEMWNIYETEDVDYGKYVYERDAESETVVESEADAARDTETLSNEGLCLPYGYSPFTDEQIGENIYLDILNKAKRYVHIMTPYLVPDDNIKSAIKNAAKRGVDVKIMLPHIPDKKYAFCVARSFYEELLECGVKIFEYEPGFLHAKEFIADDEICTVGTVNLDYRSMYLHFECGLVVYKNKVVEEVEADYQYCLGRCIEVDMNYYKSMSFAYRTLGKVLRVTGPLL